MEINSDEYGILSILQRHNAEAALTELTSKFDQFCNYYMSDREGIRGAVFTVVSCYLLSALYESEGDNSMLRVKIESLNAGLNKSNSASEVDSHAK